MKQRDELRLNYGGRGVVVNDWDSLRRQFELNVRRAMQGGNVAGQSFSNVMR